MRSMALRPIDEELRIERNPAIRAGVELHHPAVDPFGIELRIDGAVERIGEVDAFAIAADLDHLGAAIELAVLGAGMRRARDDSADPHFARELWLERIAYVVLLQIAGAPARDIAEAIVHGQIDISDERRHGFESLQERRQKLRLGRLGGD